MPACIGSDMGTETPPPANAHLRLSQPNSLKHELNIQDVYWYGPSTKNQ